MTFSYSLLQDYVVSPDRVERGETPGAVTRETPGALTYSERIARKFMEGDTVSYQGAISNSTATGSLCSIWLL